MTMVMRALVLFACLGGPSGKDRAAGDAAPAPARLAGVHAGGSIRPHGHPTAAPARRAGFDLSAAILGDMDDDETEDDSPFAAITAAPVLEVGPGWVRSAARPGSGQVSHPSGGRIPLRC